MLPAALWLVTQLLPGCDPCEVSRIHSEIQVKTEPLSRIGLGQLGSAENPRKTGFGSAYASEPFVSQAFVSGSEGWWKEVTPNSSREFIQVRCLYRDGPHQRRTAF